MNLTSLESQALLDLSRPNLHALSYILRHEELWPKDFKWDYSSCHSCAMGMAYELWNIQPRAVDISREMKIGLLHAMAIFDGFPMSPFATESEEFYGKEWENVTPIDIADAIDAFLVRRA